MSRVIFLIVFSAACIITIYFMSRPDEKPLPVINPIDLEYGLVDTSVLSGQTGYGHKIGEFEFLDQFGRKIGSSEVKNKVYVAEYFFTTCGTICPIMNTQMQRVQEVYKEENDVKILSFTVNPEVDTVEQMLRYANDHGAIKDKWYFLTGTKKDLYGLARKSYFVLKPAESQNLGDAGSDFIHTNNFVLVDRKSRIRGYYDGTSGTSVDSLIHDISRLLEEKN